MPNNHHQPSATITGQLPGIIVSLEHVTRLDIDGSETLAKGAREINASGAAGGEMCGVKVGCPIVSH